MSEPTDNVYYRIARARVAELEFALLKQAALFNRRAEDMDRLRDLRAKRDRYNETEGDTDAMMDMLEALDLYLDGYLPVPPAGGPTP